MADLGEENPVNQDPINHDLERIWNYISFIHHCASQNSKNGNIVGLIDPLGENLIIPFINELLSSYIIDNLDFKQLTSSPRGIYICKVFSNCPANLDTVRTTWIGSLSYEGNINITIHLVKDFVAEPLIKIAIIRLRESPGNWDMKIIPIQKIEDYNVEKSDISFLSLASILTFSAFYNNVR